jgi:cation transport ATPase
MKKLGIIVLLTIFSLSGAMAQLIKVDQEVFGMDCAPCAYGLERGLNKMDGLEKVQVSLNKGKAYLQLASNNKLTLKKIQEEVKNNGFSARNAEVTVKGELNKTGDKWQLKTQDEIFSIDSDTPTEVLNALNAGKATIKGLVKDEEDGNLDSSWKIQVTEIL